ncbi:MAG: hypothetical protein HZC54_07910 [Verrucomicrobia bacterium]|nr:hypothetical protein [Verrucomicrobiota bacterium]
MNPSIFEAGRPLQVCRWPSAMPEGLLQSRISQFLYPDSQFNLEGGVPARRKPSFNPENAFPLYRTLAFHSPTIVFLCHNRQKHNEFRVSRLETVN